MKKFKGFTLPEMVAVIAILMFLAALSTPFVKGYIDDAYNGKALNYMRELYEASLNFEKDYPGTTISDEGSEFTGCNIDRIYGVNGLVLKPKILTYCHYIKPVPEDLIGRYEFTIGSDAVVCEMENEECANARVIMTGKDEAGIYKDKCACVTTLGRVCKKNSDNSTNCL